MTLCVNSVGNNWKHDIWTVDELVVYEPFTGPTVFDLSEKDVYDPPPLPEVDMDTSAQAPGSVHVPKEPAAQERAAHELTHLPFRSWCKTCVRSKSRHDHSKKLRLKQPVLQSDYTASSQIQKLKDPWRFSTFVNLHLLAVSCTKDVL